MSKAFPPHAPAKSTALFGARRLPGFWRALTFGLIVAGLALLLPSLAPLAQHVKDSQSPLTVTGIGARQTSAGTVVTVAADGPLNRTQSWQEGDRFHLVLPYAAGSQLRNLPRGVRVNRVSSSLEIIVNMKSGASVTVDPRFNHLNLIVNGGLNLAQNSEADSAETTGQSQRSQERAAARESSVLSSRPVRERSAEVASEPRLTPPPTRSSTSAEAASSSASASPRLPAVSSFQTSDGSLSSANKAQAQTQTAAAPTGAVPPAAVASSSPASSNATQLAPATDDALAPGKGGASPAAAPPADTQGGGLFSMIFSTTGVAILITLGLLALVFLRLRPSLVNADKVEAVDKEVAGAREESVALEVKAPAAPVAKVEKSGWERRKSLRRKNDKRAAANAANAQSAQATEQSLETRAPSSVTTPAVFYGAYRVDQEVGKLVLGQPHRMDVLSSRAPDDRRAIETSLLKALNAPEADADGRRRARQALEEYGFLARHSAALLLAQDACDRAAAARVLGVVAAPIALPFLLEALYDSEAIVRNQAVSSIGALKLPSAIGALLDMARRHPEMPSGPLSQALSACSLDCLDIGGGVFEPERQLLYGETAAEFNGEIQRLEPSANYEQLPEFLEDETLAEALERLEHTDVEVRAAAARRLAQFQSQTSVAALTALATRDPEATVRTAAVTSLGEIDHESVFAPVLMAFADEAREVQAAAARALSRLSFNRADAYVRIIETADEESLGNVARACIRARMAAQAVDRLASQDRRQAYEAFSLLSLLAKARETEPILEAIAQHRDTDVQLAAIRLLGITGGPEVAQQFRQLAVREGMSEKIRTALLEVVYKLDQTLPV